MTLYLHRGGSADVSWCHHLPSNKAAKKERDEPLPYTLLFFTFFWPEFSHLILCN